MDINMTKEEAKRVLRYHAFMDENINHPKMGKGFLGMLRPFSGEILEENYHSIMHAIKILADDLRNSNIDKEIILAIWSICHLSRSWAIEKEGMLQRNDLISPDQTEQISSWIEGISYSVLMILSGSDDKTAFEHYE